MSQWYDCDDVDERDAGLEAAVTAIRAGSLVVLPTDTVYGVGADAFDPAAVGRVLAAKGRGRDMPVPVLVSARATLDALALGVSAAARELVEQHWPGPLTLVCKAQPSLQWDLGDSRGTVALRMPDCELALALLARTGPLAVSSANRSGSRAASTAREAMAVLGDAIEVYLDGGPLAVDVPSTIVDVTSRLPKVLRSGALGVDRLRELMPDLMDAS